MRCDGNDEEEEEEGRLSADARSGPSMQLRPPMRLRLNELRLRAAERRRALHENFLQAARRKPRSDSRASSATLSFDSTPICGPAPTPAPSCTSTVVAAAAASAVLISVSHPWHLTLPPPPPPPKASRLPAAFITAARSSSSFTESPAPPGLQERCREDLPLRTRRRRTEHNGAQKPTSTWPAEPPQRTCSAGDRVRRVVATHRISITSPRSSSSSRWQRFSCARHPHRIFLLVLRPRICTSGVVVVVVVVVVAVVTVVVAIAAGDPRPLPAQRAAQCAPWRPLPPPPHPPPRTCREQALPRAEHFRLQGPEQLRSSASSASRSLHHATFASRFMRCTSASVAAAAAAADWIWRLALLRRGTLQSPPTRRCRPPPRNRGYWIPPQGGQRPRGDSPPRAPPRTPTDATPLSHRLAQPRRASAMPREAPAPYPPWRLLLFLLRPRTPAKAASSAPFSAPGTKNSSPVVVVVTAASSGGALPHEFPVPSSAPPAPSLARPTFATRRGCCCCCCGGRGPSCTPRARTTLRWSHICGTAARPAHTPGAPGRASASAALVVSNDNNPRRRRRRRRPHRGSRRRRQCRPPQ